MGLASRFMSYLREDVPVRQLDRARGAGTDAYELVDELPRGPRRLAAWNAYVLQTYGDKLIEASETSGAVRPDIADAAGQLYRLAGAWTERAREATPDPGDPARAGLPGLLPHWPTPVRTQYELAGMRATLDVLRVQLTFELQRFEADEATLGELRARLAAINAKVDTADGLWIKRAPDELRGGIGDALAAGLDLAYALGQTLASSPG